jgi:phosphate transport system substrate-binding protein
MQRKFNLFFAVVMIMALVLSACGSKATTVAPAATAAATEMPVKATNTSAPKATDTVAPKPTDTVAPKATDTAAPEVPTTTSEPTLVPDMGVMLPEIDPATVSGDIIAAGSSTVYPLAERMAERFKDEGFAGNITIDSIGSGAGFERFCKTGETDISNASRKIKDSEVENCKAIGRTPVSFRIGTDAIAFVVSSENDFLTDVTLEELAKIFSKDAVKWSDVNPAWPNEDIKRFAPGTDSGTFDYFVEVVMGPAYKDAAGKADLVAGEKAILDATNIQFSEDDNVLVQGVEGSKYAIGFFGFAYYVENQAQLKAISVNGVAPSLQTAEDNSYPLSRPLFIYSDANILKEKPQVAAFINFFLSYVNEEIETVGYFPASQEALDAAKQALLDALK